MMMLKDTMFRSFGALLAAATLVASTQAMLVETLIDFGTSSSVGNGSFFNEPSDASTVNFTGTLSTNTNGRALIDIGTTPATNFSDFSTITDNRGVSINGWTNYRWFYLGGNSGMGFLEHGGRLGLSNATNNGSAFANGNDWILVSDAIPVTGGLQSDTFNVSALVGSDNAASIELDTYLVLDDSTVIQVDDRTIAGNPDPDDLSLAGETITADYSTIRLMFSVDSVAGGRGLIDNVQFQRVSAIPEPSLAGAFLALSTIGLTVSRRRVS